MSITKKEIDTLASIIKRLYLEDDIPWVIGYSGGKDSTATLQLVWHALSELPVEQRMKKAVHVISTDTLVESPVVAKWVATSLTKISEISGDINNPMPFIAHKLIPDYNDTFWVNLLGRGYPYPRPNFRWCTDRLKIKPSNTFVQNVVSKFGEVILLLGTRKAESTSRAKTMEYYEKLRVRDFLSPNGTIQNELVFSPLENWSDDDVWFFLMQHKNPWGHSNKDLLTMYRGATSDGECPLVISSDTPSCGKSRFGCWVCTMVEQDKSMAAMIMNDSEKEWMTPLLEFRNYIGDAAKDRDRRDFRRMTGNTFLFHGRLVHGPYKKEVREKWLHTLLTIQESIQRTGPEGFRSIELITNEELHCIRKIWLDEKHEFDDSLPVIYKNVTGKDFTESEIPSETLFGKQEWELLADVCQDLYEEEELMLQMVASIIDIEQKSSDLKKRRGVVSKIENQIKKSFYKDEIDACNFAMEKLQRKKNMGASYDPKAEAEDIQLDLWEIEEEIYENQ